MYTWLRSLRHGYTRLHTLTHGYTRLHTVTHALHSVRIPNTLGYIRLHMITYGACIFLHTVTYAVTHEKCVFYTRLQTRQFTHGYTRLHTLKNGSMWPDQAVTDLNSPHLGSQGGLGCGPAGPCICEWGQSWLQNGSLPGTLQSIRRTISAWVW